MDRAIELATVVLGQLAGANARAGQLCFKDFYNDAVNNDDFNLKEDYHRWKDPTRSVCRSVGCRLQDHDIQRSGATLREE